MGGLSENPASLLTFEKSLEDDSRIRFASHDDTNKILGFAFCAVAVVLIVYIGKKCPFTLCV